MIRLIHATSEYTVTKYSILNTKTSDRWRKFRIYLTMLMVSRRFKINLLVCFLYYNFLYNILLCIQTFSIIFNFLEVSYASIEYKIYIYINYFAILRLLP